MLSIHQDIYYKLNYFIKIKKIPNIIFYGPHGSGKKTLLNDFLKNIYQNLDVEKYIMKINCGHGKGIKFIREELKFFGKSNINHQQGDIFKSIILLNADKLTSDAQSALRRCIETYSHNTRFFIIVEDKNKLLKPILSRFCEIYIDLPIIDSKQVQLYDYQLNKELENNHKIEKYKWIKNNIEKERNIQYYLGISDILYEKGYHIFDLLDYFEKETDIDELTKYTYLTYFDKIRIEFRDERLILFIVIYYLFMRPNINLENVSFM